MADLGARFTPRIQPAGMSITDERCVVSVLEAPQVAPRGTPWTPTDNRTTSRALTTSMKYGNNIGMKCSHESKPNRDQLWQRPTPLNSGIVAPDRCPPMTVGRHGTQATTWAARHCRNHATTQMRSIVRLPQRRQSYKSSLPPPLPPAPPPSHLYTTGGMTHPPISPPRPLPHPKRARDAPLLSTCCLPATPFHSHLHRKQ